MKGRERVNIHILTIQHDDFRKNVVHEQKIENTAIRLFYHTTPCSSVDVVVVAIPSSLVHLHCSIVCTAHSPQRSVQRTLRQMSAKTDTSNMHIAVSSTIGGFLGLLRTNIERSWDIGTISLFSVRTDGLRDIGVPGVRGATMDTGMIGRVGVGE